MRIVGDRLGLASYLEWAKISGKETHLCRRVDDRDQFPQVFAQQGEIQNAVLVFQTLEKTILVERALLTIKLIVGPLTLFVQGSYFER